MEVVECLKVAHHHFRSLGGCRASGPPVQGGAPQLAGRLAPCRPLALGAAPRRLHRLARSPLVEVLAGDPFRLRDLSWEDPFAPRAVLDVGAQVGSFTCALADPPARGKLDLRGTPSERAAIAPREPGPKWPGRGVPRLCLWRSLRPNCRRSDDVSCEASLTPATGRKVIRCGL